MSLNEDPGHPIRPPTVSPPQERKQQQNPRTLWKVRLALFAILLGVALLLPVFYYSPSDVSHTVFLWYFYVIDTKFGPSAYPDYAFGMKSGYFFIFCIFVLIPTLVGMIVCRATGRAIRSDPPQISARLRQVTVWSAVAPLFWIVNEIILNINWLVQSLEGDPNLRDFIRMDFQAYAATILSVSLAWICLHLPRSKAKDFLKWAPTAKLTFSLSRSKENFTRTLWWKRTISFTGIAIIQLGWFIFLVISSPWKFGSWITYSVTFSDLWPARLVWYFLPFLLGIVSCTETRKVLATGKNHIPPGIKFAAKMSIVISALGALTHLMNALVSPGIFYSLDVVGFFFLTETGDLACLPLLWYLARITFETPTGNALDFRWQGPIVSTSLEAGLEISRKDYSERGDSEKKWHNLAMVYEKAGKTGEALYCWDQAALLGDIVGKKRGIELRSQRIKAVFPVELKKRNNSGVP